VNEAEFFIEKLFKKYKASNMSELAKLINISQKTISNWKIRNAVSAIKKKCRELDIYNDIFEETATSFVQTGKNSHQIQTQNNPNNSNINNLGSLSSPRVDSDILKLVEALSSVADVLNKKEELKQELTKLITRLPAL